ncbi:TetR/AcrR family transcriptional regulator [Nocardia aobensis]|uniref:TetR/AcrR family transcriptional regulator n=1 Tax=Nocardia aobensis TaxID=257277 RepID=A0ABW6PFK4_9NOCA
MASTTGQRSSRSADRSSRAGRRQEYIDAAAKVFYLRGYDSATIGNIAESLDVTKAALYYYIESKEDLLFEIIREMHLLNMANLERCREIGGKARSRLWHYFCGHTLVNLENIEKSTVVYRDLAHLSQDRRKEIIALRDETQQFVRELLNQAVAEKSVCEKLNVEFASIEMFTTANAVYSWFRADGSAQPVEAAERMADYIIGGVSCTGPDDLSCPRHHPPK